LENRLYHFRVSLLDDSRKLVWQQMVTESPDPDLTLHLSPMPVPLISVDSQTGARRPATQPFAWDECPQDARRHVAIFQTAEAVGFPRGINLNFNLAFEDQPGDTSPRLGISATTMRAPIVDIPAHIIKIKATPPSQRTVPQRAALSKFYRHFAPGFRELRKRLAALEQQLGAVQD